MDNPLRSVGAVIAGIFVGVVLTVATDALLHAMGVFPPVGKYTPDGPLALATVYRVIYSILASYVTARVAPNWPMRHALVGGGIGLVLSTVGAVITWDMNLGAHWYSIAVAAIAMPCAWVGGLLYERGAGARA